MRKFVAQPVSGAQPITLGDDEAGDKISVGLPASKNEVQEFRPFRGQFTIRFNRGNIVNAITWVVDRDHGDEATATDFVRDHAQAVLALGLCNVQDSGKGLSVRWWTNAEIKVTCRRHDGQSTVFEYQMEAGPILPTLPAS